MDVKMENVHIAAEKLRGVARKTALIESSHFKGVYLKTENLQVTGSFKLRGAYYKISTLSEEEKKKGVVACSAGNHAQGVALACNRLGIQATILMPETAPISKVEATKSYGADVRLVGNVYDDAYAAAIEFNESEGKTFIHPFNDEILIAGQGTVALEIFEEIEDIDAIVVPIGGGGLISGIAFVAKSLNPNCKIYGVEAESANAMKLSKENHKLMCVESVCTFADGIAVKKPGDITFKLVEEYVDEIITVSEDEIAAGVLELMEKQKLVCEGSGAIGYAAIMHNKIPYENKKVAVVLSGGNIDVNILSKVVNRGLLMGGRNAKFKLVLTDKPGNLAKVVNIIGKLGANIIAIEHNEGEENMEINCKIVKFVIETRSAEHIKEIKDRIKQEGIKIISM